MNATEVTAGPAESNGRLLLSKWRDSLHVTCGLTACTPGSAPGPTLGNEYGKTLPLPLPSYHCTALFFRPLIPFISTLTSLTFSRFLLFPSVFFTSRASSFPFPRSPHFFPFTFPVPIVNHQTCPIPLFSPLSLSYPSRFFPVFSPNLSTP